MTHKYWDDFLVTGFPKFPNQAQLNKALEFVPSTYRLELDDANPLTVLLLVTHESLSLLRAYLEDKNQKWRKYEADNRKATGVIDSKHIQYRVEPMYNSTASGIKSPQITAIFPKNLVSQPLTNPNFRQTLHGLESALPSDATFYGIKAHMSVYSFFNTISSILDRLANELAQLFPGIIKASRPDWGTLFDRAGQCIFAAADPGLASVLQNHRTRIDSAKTLRYRNVHTHQGYIRILIEADTNSHEWRIFLPDDPDNTNSHQSILAIPFMTTELSHTIELLDRVYGTILNKLGSSSPPW